MTLTEFMAERYKNREDKDNMFGVGVFVDPLGQTQINEIALYEILEKYSKRYRKECKCKK